MCTSFKTNQYGADPLIMQWTIVRGDTSPLAIHFLEDDEITFLDTSSWQVMATSYDPNGDLLDDLNASVLNGVVTIDVPASITEQWGTSYKSVVAELQFDLQVTITEGSASKIWTPVIGTIRVIGDITPGGSL